MKKRSISRTLRQSHIFTQFKSQEMKKSWKRVFERRSRGAECVSGGCDSDSCVAPDGLIWTETPMPWAPRIIFQIISINYVSINFLKAWQMLSSAAVWSLIVIVIMWWHAQQRLPASRPEGPITTCTVRAWKVTLITFVYFFKIFKISFQNPDDWYTQNCLPQDCLPVANPEVGNIRCSPLQPFSALFSIT